MTQFWGKILVESFGETLHELFLEQLSCFVSSLFVFTRFDKILFEVSYFVIFDWIIQISTVYLRNRKCVLNFFEIVCFFLQIRNISYFFFKFN